MKRTVTAVCLGRFAPLHIGHQKMIDKVIQRHGEDYTLVIIGSVNNLGSRTPYSYNLRKKMIKKIFPGLNVIPLHDTDFSPHHKTATLNKLWLDSLAKIENRMNTNFIFYGGSSEDLKILSQRFKTSIIFDRNTAGMGISATKVRDAINNSDLKTVRSMVDNKIYKCIVPNITHYDASMHRNFKKG